MDHLTEQKNTLARIFFNGFVTDFNGIFYAITKTKMSGDVKFYRAKVQNGGREILLSQIANSADLFNFSGNG
jgi:hypothetical protein